MVRVSTMDEMMAAALKLTDKAKGISGFVGRGLKNANLPLYTFIIFEAVATRWHYWIDVAAGLALTALAIAITTALFRSLEAEEAARLR